MYNGIGGKIRLVCECLFLKIYFKHFEIGGGDLSNFDHSNTQQIFIECQPFIKYTIEISP